MSNLKKYLNIGAELFHACRQTDMTKLIIAVCDFANVPKIEAMPSLPCMPS